LQRGALHQEIRARDASSARVFRAEVLGKGKLRAVF
jgi:flagella basal body P-ring formation protein FlgA